MKPNPRASLESFAEEIKDLSLEDFLRRNHTPFLLVSEHIQGQPSTFRTGSVDVSSGKKPSDADARAPSVVGQQVFPLRKSRRNTFQNMISLGRTTNNDIVLDHPNVSKLHAFFRAQPDGEGFTVTDSGSTLGTTIDGAPLVPQKAVPVESGQILLFGRSVAATFLSPKGLFEHIASLRFYGKI